MDDPFDLAALRGGMDLLQGEIVLEGWAASRKDSGGWVAGLALVTNERLLFADVDGGRSAFPISKIYTVEIVAPDAFTVLVWYGRLQLAFDNQDAARAMLNVLRQDRRWAALEMAILDRPRAALDLPSRAA